MSRTVALMLLGITFVTGFACTPSPEDVPRPSTSTSEWPTGSDALQRKALAELRTFTDWLAAGDAEGYIGEIGWPNEESADRWNAAADVWFEAADATGLWVTAWATGEWWGSYDLLVYGNRGGSVGKPLGPARVLEEHLGGAAADRGVNVNGGEFGIGENLGAGSGGSFSNRSRGVYDRDYHYETQATFDFLASRGVEVVRLPFRWERMQPSPGGALDPTELGRYTAQVERARRAGLQVIPTAMNYGAYWLHDPGTGRGVRTPIGSAQIRTAHFADLWGQLAGALRNHANVAGWGLMNEPTKLPGGAGAWEAASQEAVLAIRAAGDRRVVLVPGYNWSTVSRFPETHPGGPWISDPAGAVRYEAHHYFDADNSGEYRSYADELSEARSRGY